MRGSVLGGDSRIKKFTHCGGNGLRVPPVPIPNTEVKPQHADGTWLETARESRSLPHSNSRSAIAGRAFFVGFGVRLLGGVRLLHISFARAAPSRKGPFPFLRSLLHGWDTRRQWGCRFYWLRKSKKRAAVEASLDPATNANENKSVFLESH